MKALILFLFTAALWAQNGSPKDLQIPVLQREPGVCTTDQEYRNAITNHVRICGPDNTWSDLWPSASASTCVLSGSQTNGYVLTATDNGTGCSWQTVGGASVSIDTISPSAEG